MPRSRKLTSTANAPGRSQRRGPSLEIYSSRRKVQNPSALSGATINSAGTSARFSKKRNFKTLSAGADAACVCSTGVATSNATQVRPILATTCESLQQGTSSVVKLRGMGAIGDSPVPPCYERLAQVATAAWELSMEPDCQYCDAVRFPDEPPGFCCQSGTVKIDVPRMHPRLWDLFVNDVTPIGKEFRKRCRSYNNTMAFSSIAYEQEGKFTNNDEGCYTLKLQGIISHYIKNLIPKDGLARHAQLYFFGTETELENRVAQGKDLEKSIIELLLDILKVNPYHNLFVRARELPSRGSLSILLRRDPALDKNVYNLPVVDHVAGIWHENGDDVEKKPTDIRVYFKQGGSAQINYYYGCYDPLRYLLLHPFGESGWRMGLKKLVRSDCIPVNLPYNADRLSDALRDPTVSSSAAQLLEAERDNLLDGTSRRGRRDNISLREYYAYLFQIRRKDKMSILRTGRLLQQYQIDMYIKLETQRLDYIRKNQKKKRFERRGETYMEVSKIVNKRKKVKGFAVGQRVKLNTSFVGGPRDLRRRYMDALALVNEFGSPDFFITMTCNPKWPEIQRELHQTEQVCNRADLITRVFRAKNEELKRELINYQLFGKVAAYLYVIEFQKRGLPHVHWLVIMEPGFKVHSIDGYDRFVSAELPDPSFNKHLHDCVTRHMIHGPCGKLKKKNVCMVNGSCKNNYPKSFSQATEHREDSYPAYRRSENGVSVRVRGHNLDNRWVVPYNPYLLAKFDCHINVEICSDIKSVKYLYKYVCKGNDQVAYNVVDDDATETIDEIQNYRTARWICAPEAMWRLYRFDLFAMYPPVQQLHVHLPGYHWLQYGDDADLEDVIEEEKSGMTQLTEFFKMNQTKKVKDLNLLYKDFPRFFVWNKKTRKWTRRRRCTPIGRLVTVHILDAERYYLRLLLNHVCAPTSFEELRTYQNICYDSFREAALHRGLLQSDSDLQKAMEEASGYKMPYALRRFLCIILVNNSPSDPRALWTNFKNELSQDILRECRGDIELSYRLALQNIGTILYSMGHDIDKYKLESFPIGLSHEEMSHREYLSELHVQVSQDDLNVVGLLNAKQRSCFQEIMESVRTSGGRSFFVDGPGGTGKTFLYKALLATVRSTGGIALAVASSGVAASLLPNGRTAHSRFKLPLKVDETLSCTIKKNTGEAALLIAASLIIWDEACMANRRHIEALNLLLQDLMCNTLLFGGKTVVFGGDFRQIIPIVEKGTREACVDACLTNSILWRNIKKMRLTENMRAKEDHEFVEFLMRVGEGTESCVYGDYIQLPPEMCLPYSNEGDPLVPLIEDIFPDFAVYENEPSLAINRAILTPKNDDVEHINSALISQFPGAMKEYISTNFTKDPKQQMFYEDFLNGIDVGALPPHVLQLKANCPVILMRNINPTEGLCNGTRLIIREAGERMLLATIAFGSLAGKDVLIPRVALEFDDIKLCPVPFKRLQFPVRLCFAMTINKAQGQTLERVGIYLPSPVFAHGQLYVALSRAKKSTAVRVLIKPTTTDFNSAFATRNVVFREVLTTAT